MGKQKAKSETTGVKLIGRPLTYKTPEEFDIAVQLYFNTVKGIPNKAGLLVHLHLSRETWREYKERPQFVDTIKWAESMIEDAWIQQLTGPGATGPIFYLKNAFKEHYKDRHETDVTSGGKPLLAFDPTFDATTREAERDS